MTTSQTTHSKAEIGRRVLFTRYSDLNNPNRPQTPGIITGLNPQQGASVKIRLDGRRSTFYCRPDFEGLRYLDQVVPVPELPMGRFKPTPDDVEGVWEGVPVCSISEDGDIVLLTTDRDAAVRAATAYLKDAWADLDFVHWDALQLRWAYFEWQPEDAECEWFMHWTHEGDDHALHLYYLPA